MEKFTLKIENLFSAIVSSHNYENFSASYDNNLKAQKDFLKQIVIPKITAELDTLTASKVEYNPIKITSEGKLIICLSLSTIYMYYRTIIKTMYSLHQCCYNSITTITAKPHNSQPSNNLAINPIISITA